MKAVLVLVLVSLMAGSQSVEGRGFHPFGLVSDILKAALEELNNLIKAAEGVLEFLKNFVESAGKFIIDEITESILTVIDTGRQILVQLGECGIAEIGNLEKLGEDAIIGAARCVATFIPDAADVVEKLASGIGKAVKLAADGAGVIAECEARGPILSLPCFAEKAPIIISDINDVITSLTPVLESALKLESDIVACKVDAIEQITLDVKKFTDDIVKVCLGQS